WPAFAKAAATGLPVARSGRVLGPTCRLVVPVPAAESAARRGESARRYCRDGGRRLRQEAGGHEKLHVAIRRLRRAARGQGREGRKCGGRFPVQSLEAERRYPSTGTAVVVGTGGGDHAARGVRA